jgi:Arc/MetJ-type ribon-helix-helix transcriptional regulator
MNTSHLAPPKARQRSGTSSSSSPSSRGLAATVHVDLGADLKSAVCAAALQAGVRPSEWMRSQLAQAVSADALRPPEKPLSAPQRRRPSEASGPGSGTKSHQLSLQCEDLHWLDQVAQAGGFRSRPAALRYALRVLAADEGVEALKRLPETIPMLVHSNMTLQSALRAYRSLGSDAHEQSRFNDQDTRTLRQKIGEHLEHVARLVAALQPLLETHKEFDKERVR